MAGVKFRKVGVPLSESILLKHESSWGFRLPEPYRAFLLQNNGGSPVKDCFNFKESTTGSDLRRFLGITGESLDLPSTLAIYKGRLPARFFPIGKDSGGNVICISVADDDLGKVYFWDHDTEAGTGESPELAMNTILIADSFQEFLEGLYE
jgi:hypothetical protein